MRDSFCICAMEKSIALVTLIECLHNKSLDPSIILKLSNVPYSIKSLFVQKAEWKLAHFAKIYVGEPEILGRDCPERNSHVCIICKLKTLFYVQLCAD